MTAPELDLTAAIEAALAESYRPRKDPGYSFLNRASYDNLWGPHVETMVEAALPHIREALAQQWAEKFNELGLHIEATRVACDSHSLGMVDGLVSAARIVRGES